MTPLSYPYELAASCARQYADDMIDTLAAGRTASAGRGGPVTRRIWQKIRSFCIRQRVEAPNPAPVVFDAQTWFADHGRHRGASDATLGLIGAMTNDGSDLPFEKTPADISAE